MTLRRATTIGALALTLGSGAWALTTGASAQANLAGTVAHVDPSTRTIFFTDGSIIQLKPGATLYVDGRAVPIDDLAPGARAAVDRSMASPATETTTVVTPPAPVDVHGTIASVDTQAGVITFTDGRVIRATEGTFVWLPVPVASLQPGMTVVVRDAADTSTTVVTPARAERHAAMTRTRTDRHAGSALPRGAFNLSVPPDQVHVHFPPQAP